MKKPRILTVDDEVSFTDLLSQYFEPRGYDIVVASNGNEGLELFKNGSYDVVLLDLKMGGLNGDEVMREMQNIQSNAKIIFITAYNDTGKTEEGLLQEGAYAFVEKPVTSLKDLEATINKAAESG